MDTNSGKSQLISKPVKTEEDLAYQEYLLQLELAIENH
jgi:hypothetical protein